MGLAAHRRSRAASHTTTNVSTPPTDHYVSIIDGQVGIKERGRLGIVVTPDVNNASFLIVPGLADPTNVSLVSQSTTPMFNGKYVTLSNQNSGTCTYTPPSGDVYLDASGAGVTQTWILGTPPPPPPPPAASVVIDTASGPDHVLNPHHAFGCHIDVGYAQEPRGYTSNILYGSSFEKGTTAVYAWNNITASTANAIVQLDGSVSVNPNLPVPSLYIDYTSGTGVAGWSNRGLGNEGLYLVAEQEYEGYVVIFAPNGASLYVAANDFTSGTLLASQTISVPASAQWQQVNFSFTVSAGTECVGIVPGSDATVDCGRFGANAGHICVKCGGEFQVGLNAAGSAHIGYVWFEPGTWGRLGDLHVLKGAADVLTQMNVKTIRQGGTVSQSLRWKDWRGPMWMRGSMQHVWGDSLVGGWGPFEFFDMAAALGIEPVITLAYDLNNASDWADLVEYCYGDETTTWGNIRINVDNHPEPFLLHTTEIGNEQEVPPWVDIVTAMEARRIAIAAPEFYYLYPTNGGVSSATAQQIINAGIAPSSVAPDCHVGGGGGVSCGISDFNALPNFGQSFWNMETNDGISTQLRAVHEAADLQTWFNVGEPYLHRMHGRMASFCTER
jgi:hypothetical protein